MKYIIILLLVFYAVWLRHSYKAIAPTARPERELMAQLWWWVADVRSWLKRRK